MAGFSSDSTGVGRGVDGVSVAAGALIDPSGASGLSGLTWALVFFREEGAAISVKLIAKKRIDRVLLRSFLFFVINSILIGFFN